MTELKKNLDQRGYYILPQLISRKDIAICLDEVAKFPRRYTYLNKKDQSESWEEISLPYDSHSSAMLMSNKLRNDITSAYFPCKDVVFWANEYREGQRVQKHCDTGGDLQIIMMLRSPPRKNGGELIIHFDGPCRVFLREGQRLVFRANRTPHETTRIQRISSEESTCLNRVVAVARVYF